MSACSLSERERERERLCFIQKKQGGVRNGAREEAKRRGGDLSVLC